MRVGIAVETASAFSSNTGESCRSEMQQDSRAMPERWGAALGIPSLHSPNITQMEIGDKDLDNLIVPLERVIYQSLLIPPAS